MDNKQGKNILVVGASSGIGEALATQLIAEGATVYAWSRRKPSISSPQLLFTEVDITTDLQSVVSSLPEHLHGMAYCPGSINLKPFHRLSLQDFEQDFKINVSGLVNSLQVSLKALKAGNPSSVVLFSTVAVQTGMGFHASVAAAKGAVEGLGRSLAAELAPQQIRVNVLAPSLTDTPLASALLNTPEKREASSKRHPLGKIGTPEDLAEAASFLLDERSGWITGQVIGIDGGMGSLK